MSVKHERLRDPGLVYAFVDMEPEPPVVYVVPSEVVAEVVALAQQVLVQRVTVTDRRVSEIEWVPQARPFMKRQRVCPQGALRARPLSDDDPLAWYVA
jgi:hypothetical protein